MSRISAILFDLGNVELLTVSNILLEIVGDLLISEELVGLLVELDLADDLVAGDIFGAAYVQATSPLPTPDPIPEPTTAILLGLGLAGLAGTRRRKASA